MPSSKATVLLLLSMSLTAFGFNPTRPFLRARIFMSSTTNDATETEKWQMALMTAYDEAEEAVAKHGVMSQEAKLSWEKVDDLENLPSALVAEVPKGLDQECDVLTDEQKCREFEYAMKKLDELAQGAQTINYQIKYHTEKLQNLKLDGASNRQSKSRRKISTSAINSAQYKVAKAEAEAANKEFGADSPQAKVAWSEVYEIVASEGRNERVSKVALEEECIIDDTSAACRDYAAKMKDLQKALNSPANSD